MNESTIHEWLQENIKDFTEKQLWKNDLLDDVALIKTKNKSIALTTDSLVENNHFRFDYCDAKDIAHKLFYKNYSDLIVKNVEPQFCLLNLNISSDFLENKDGVLVFLKTLKKLLKKHRVVLCGGDVTSSETNVFTMTMGGQILENKKNFYIPRKNLKIKKGDLIVLTGKVGGSQFELSKVKPPEKNISRKLGNAYRRPKPYLKLLEFYEKAKVLASIDLSDSLHQSLSILAKLNQYEFEINLDNIPVAKILRGEIGPKKKSIKKYFIRVVNSAEDLNALMILPAQQKNNLIGLNATIIGRVKCGKLQGNICYFLGGKKLSKDFNLAVEKKEYSHF